LAPLEAFSAPNQLCDAALTSWRRLPLGLGGLVGDNGNKSSEWHGKKKQVNIPQNHLETLQNNLDSKHSHIEQLNSQFSQKTWCIH
jgi:hypothetical protein